MHLLGTIVFAVVLSPAIYRWVVENDSLEIAVFDNREVIG